MYLQEEQSANCPSRDLGSIRALIINLGNLVLVVVVDRVVPAVHDC